MTMDKDRNQTHYILLCSISLEPIFDYNKFLFLHYSNAHLLPILSFHLFLITNLCFFFIRHTLQMGDRRLLSSLTKSDTNHT
jgi:hypothetical protein